MNPDPAKSIPGTTSENNERAKKTPDSRQGRASQRLKSTKSVPKSIKTTNLHLVDVFIVFLNVFSMFYQTLGPLISSAWAVNPWGRTFAANQKTAIENHTKTH